MMTGILRFPSTMHMTELNRVSLYKYIRSVGVRQIRLACGLVLFAYLLKPFHQPCARQYFDGCPCHRCQISHRLLEKFANRDGVLCRSICPCRPRDLGALPAPSISLESDRADTTCTRFKYPCPHHHPSCRCAN